MDVNIHPMRPEDTDGKGFVHWKSWQETYTGRMPEAFIARQTLEKCQENARRWPENTLVVRLNGKIVGFSCYGTDDSGAGEKRTDRICGRGRREKKLSYITWKRGEG